MRHLLARSWQFIFAAVGLVLTVITTSPQSIWNGAKDWREVVESAPLPEPLQMVGVALLLIAAAPTGLRGVRSLRRAGRDVNLNGVSAPPVERGEISLTPEVVHTETYGRNEDEAAFTIGLRARSVDGTPHAGAEGRLVSLTPNTNDQKILKLPDISQGLLQWGAFGSGSDRETITRGGAYLDVIVLENNDSLGKVVYFNDKLRDLSRIYLDVASWRAVVEVTSADGTTADVTFDIFKGEQGNSPHIISSSRSGTLYGPRVEIVPSSQ